MPKFSKTSLDRLNTCDSRLIRLMEVVISEMDITILCGHRGREEQNKAFMEGKSKLCYPKSKHNSYPSRAVDICPYPINWDDIDGFKELATIVKQKAQELDIPIEWGGDWIGFKDYPHWQIKD